MTITKARLGECYTSLPGAHVQEVIDKANELWNDIALTREQIYAICYILLTKE